MADKSTLRRFLWAATISILLLEAPPLTSAQSRFGTLAGTASVALVAQIPESASVAWSIQPAPGLALKDGSRASILVLQSTWHFAMGRSVTSTARLDAVSEQSQSAALLPLQLLDDSSSAGSTRKFDFASAPAFSFLPRTAPTRISLRDNFDPRLGRQTQTDALLVFHSAAPAQTPVVIITVTAL